MSITVVIFYRVLFPNEIATMEERTIDVKEGTLPIIERMSGNFCFLKPTCPGAGSSVVGGSSVGGSKLATTAAVEGMIVISDSGDESAESAEIPLKRTSVFSGRCNLHLKRTRVACLWLGQFGVAGTGSRRVPKIALIDRMEGHMGGEIPQTTSSLYLYETERIQTEPEGWKDHVVRVDVSQDDGADKGKRALEAHMLEIVHA
ncbi:hypothetical protein L1987_48706 [Smallanthus sonchifolius]|uniref:Uncharacterized protein n=1 Tax=Smallanthus sonchifolius TaxID=185202 RepID=A0ACB9FUB6_9ASTR|nr:hypothetical protein L1987_48706 [Smallanthus sonchifolius]